jgi:hypothetical protein
MIRLIFLAHRYLGIGFGLVISLWCLSGFVMMYVQFPDVSRMEQLTGLDPLQTQDCCEFPDDFSDIELNSYRVEMMAGRPVLRLSAGFSQYIIDLKNGEYLVDVSANSADAIAASFSSNLGVTGQANYVRTLDRDQWTVYGGLNPNRPLRQYRADDPAKTELYVSIVNGEMIQMTTAHERLWNWMGSVVHWVYPTMLRQNTAAWIQVIIWLSVFSLFLTVLGIYIGIRQLKDRRNGRLSPYRGVMLWHHYTGLMFGVLTLTWLFSGLLSVNPWGAFEGRSFAGEAMRARGGEFSYFDAVDALAELSTKQVPADTVRLEGSVLQGVPYLLAWDRHGRSIRLDQATLQPRPLAETVFPSIAGNLRPDVSVNEQGWLATGDAYYYDHHDQKDFPVYRVIYDDGERIYLNGASGQLAFVADRERQLSRWLFLGLHRGDLFGLMRQRPLWDLLLLPLLAGVTLGALTGTWMGCKRLFR